MSTSDGASTAGDPALEQALTEMESEGLLGGEGDPGADASQSSGDASAASAAAPAPTGDDGSSPTGTTAGAAPKAPDPSAASPAAADPLAGTEPFTYGADKKVLEGVYRVPGEGLLVPEDKASAIASLAERADVLDRVSREYSAQNATYERLSTWETTDASGKTVTLTGQQGLEAQRVEHARMSAAVEIVDGILADPSKLLSLLARDDQGRISIDPQAVETLQMRVQLAANTAEQTARSHFSKLSTGPAQPAGPQSYAASAPNLIKQAAGAHDTALTADDRQFLTQQIDRYVRTVTEEDRRWNPNLKLGAPIVDESYGKLVERTAQQRAAATAQAKAAETAGKHNAGMDKGRQPPKAPIRPATPPPVKTDDRKPRADWETPLTGALAEMGIPR